MKFLGIDVGTSSIKAVVLDDKGKILESAKTDISNLLETPRPHWIQRNAENLWNNTVSTINKLRNLEDLGALCIDATSGTIVPVDRGGNAIYSEIMYNDRRAQSELEEISERSPSAKDYEIFLPLDATLVIPKILWLRRNTRILSKTYKILHENDFVVMKLCGEPCTSPNIAGKAHLDVRTGRYQEQIYADLEIDPDLLPPVKPVGEVIGNASYEISKKTKIPRNTPVINGVTDATAGDIGTGVLEVGQIGVNMGTTMVIHAVVDKITSDPKKRLYCKVFVEGNYLIGGATNAGTQSLDAIGQLLGKTPQELDQEAEGTSPGSKGLIAQPQWVGTRVPDFNPFIRGYLVGLTKENCTAGNIFRAFLEGNAILLDEILDIIEDLTKTKTREIRVCGGGAKSCVQNQILADVTKDIVKVAETNEPAIGSAIIAFWGLSKTKNTITEIAERTIKVRKTFVPNQKNQKIYGKLKEEFRKTAKSLYPTQQVSESPQPIM
ncbi:MAG: FGGY-family carbohydrate kinase [Candidatus Hodarchaeota archaeon]